MSSGRGPVVAALLAAAAACSSFGSDGDSSTSTSGDGGSDGAVAPPSDGGGPLPGDGAPPSCPNAIRIGPGAGTFLGFSQSKLNGTLAVDGGSLTGSVTLTSGAQGNAHVTKTFPTSVSSVVVDHDITLTAQHIYAEVGCEITLIGPNQVKNQVYWVAEEYDDSFHFKFVTSVDGGDYDKSYGNVTPVPGKVHLHLELSVLTAQNKAVGTIAMGAPPDPFDVPIEGPISEVTVDCGNYYSHTSSPDGGRVDFAYDDVSAEICP